MNGVVVVGVGGIGVGNGGDLPTCDGSDSVSSTVEPETAAAVTAFAIGGYGKGRGCGCCCGERFVVGEDNLGPIGVCGSRGEGWWSASNGGVVGNGGAA